VANFRRQHFGNTTCRTCFRKGFLGAMEKAVTDHRGGEGCFFFWGKQLLGGWRKKERVCVRSGVDHFKGMNLARRKGRGGQEGGGLKAGVVGLKGGEEEGGITGKRGGKLRLGRKQISTMLTGGGLSVWTTSALRKEGVLRK